MRAGTTYCDVTRLGTLRGEISEFERPDTVVFHYAAGLLGVPVMDGWPGYTLESAGDGATRVRHRAQGHLHGPFKLLKPLVHRMARSERQRTVDALKASLESSRRGR